jgi:hypothetical protein
MTFAGVLDGVKTRTRGHWHVAQNLAGSYLTTHPRDPAGSFSGCISAHGIPFASRFSDNVLPRFGISPKNFQSRSNLSIRTFSRSRPLVGFLYLKILRLSGDNQSVDVYSLWSAVLVLESEITLFQWNTGPECGAHPAGGNCLGLDGGFAASRQVNCAICFDARDCCVTCVTETGLLVRVAASFGGSRCRSEFLSRSASRSERRFR